MEGEERTIGGREYRIQMLHVAAGRSVFVRMAKILGPALKELTDGVPTVGHLLEGNVSADAVGRALSKLIEDATEKDLKFLGDHLSKVTYVDVDGDWKLLTDRVQDTLFRGKLSEYFAWLLTALEVNFSDFFSGWASKGDALARRKEQSAEAE